MLEWEAETWQRNWPIWRLTIAFFSMSFDIPVLLAFSQCRYSTKLANKIPVRLSTLYWMGSNSQKIDSRPHNVMRRVSAIELLYNYDHLFMPCYVLRVISFSCVQVQTQVWLGLMIHIHSGSYPYRDRPGTGNRNEWCVSHAWHIYVMSIWNFVLSFGPLWVPQLRAIVRSKY